MENVKHQITVLVKLVGLAKIVQFVSLYLDVFMGLVRHHKNVIVNQVGLAFIVISVSVELFKHQHIFTVICYVTFATVFWQ